MKTQFKFIFDMDGTLYKFDKGKSTTFDESLFYIDLRKNICKFLMAKKDLSKNEALKEYDRINKQYKGEVSLGVRIEHGIDRDEFFLNTWNIKPDKYIEKDSDLPDLLSPLSGGVALLTNAPRVWTLNVLHYLQLEEIFGKALYTGEPTLRKPNPLIFKQVAKDLGIKTSQIISIGDQEVSDIIPAKTIGMKTIFIGAGKTCADYQVNSIKEAINLLGKEGFI